MAIERATGVLLPDEGCAMRKRSRAETTLSGAHLCGELLLLDRSSCSLSDEQPSGREAGSELSCEAGCEAGPGRARAAWNTCLLLASRAVAFSKRSHRSESSVCMPLSDLVGLLVSLRRVAGADQVPAIGTCWELRGVRGVWMDVQ